VATEPLSVEIVHTETDLALARERVVRSVQALREELGRRADWHEWVARRPGTIFATAFVVGFLLGQRRMR
jgi:hypothetical protein